MVKVTEEKGVYYSDCELKQDQDGSNFTSTLKCKNGRPAIRFKAEETKED